MIGVISEGSVAGKSRFRGARNKDDQPVVQPQHEAGMLEWIGIRGIWISGFAA